MTKLNHTASAECVPCPACSASTEAISLLSLSLQTAIQATRYIRNPHSGKLQLQILRALLIVLDITPATELL
jgi:hypothetical protein